MSRLFSGLAQLSVACMQHDFFESLGTRLVNEQNFTIAVASYQATPRFSLKILSPGFSPWLQDKIWEWAGNQPVIAVFFFAEDYKESIVHQRPGSH